MIILIILWLLLLYNVVFVDMNIFVFLSKGAFSSLRSILCLFFLCRIGGKGYEVKKTSEN